ncbi:uncharacterized protein LOC130648013 [Hydractinia symbiolongicarpus]|uniref:uncharacterized protein LOC130648013 n=1 Tax=Hydractinia symbiolongicarpus TaxID=13093 RepID=UPI002551A2F2|nr:uncharacterized protein LOC130648013 [Hydractinia symbiolongicarpus]
MKRQGHFAKIARGVSFASRKGNARRTNSRKSEGIKSCQKCKKVLALEKFRVLKNGKTATGCLVCLDKKKASRERKRCPYGRRRSQCKECKESSQIYQHEKRRADCKDCKGSQICEHVKQRACCKDCRKSKQSEYIRFYSVEYERPQLMFIPRSRNESIWKEPRAVRIVNTIFLWTFLGSKEMVN